MPTRPRNAYYTNESFEQDGITGREFVLAVVTENEPGYGIASTFSSLDRAKAVADQRNRLNNISEDDVRVIVASSMRAGRVSK